MNLIQIIILLFIVYVLYRLWCKLKKQELSRQLFVVWLIFWLVIAAFAIFPNSLDYFAKLVGVQRGVDTAIYISILVIFYIVFRIFVRLDKMEKNMSEIVRKVSIGNVEEKEKGSVMDRR